MEGWIKLHRRIIDHWIMKKPEYLHAWIIMLITVNFEDNKTLIHGEIIECKRGQSILSLQSWVSKFGKSWTTQKVRTYFDLLEKDKMVCIEGLRKTTRLTICNYDSYQSDQHTNNTQITRKQHTSNTQVTTIKEGEERKESNNTWRTNFEIYKQELREAYLKIAEDKAWVDSRKEYHPNVDILKSIEKVCVEYWSKEKGWKKKKASKTEEIDWPATFVNSLNFKENRVYEQNRK